MPAEFELQPHTRGRGKVGEEAAVRWLRGEGYLILDRNVTTHAGEIDVVARDGETLVFLEIKARGSALYGPAIAAVGPAKQRRLSRAASLYMAIQRLGGPCRFDVLGLDADGEGGWRYTLVRDAFPYCG
jgi:putative endonuclease